MNWRANEKENRKTLEINRFSTCSDGECRMQGRGKQRVMEFVECSAVLDDVAGDDDCAGDDGGGCDGVDPAADEMRFMAGKRAPEAKLRINVCIERLVERYLQTFSRRSCEWKCPAE